LTIAISKALLKKILYNLGGIVLNNAAFYFDEPFTWPTFYRKNKSIRLKIYGC